MTRAEAAKIMAVLAAAFPGTAVTEETAEVWYRAVLRDLGYEEGQVCVERLITNPDRQSPHSFPKLSEMQAIRRARVRELQASAPARQIEDSKPVPATVAKANIAMLRSKLRTTAKRL